MGMDPNLQLWRTRDGAPGLGWPGLTALLGFIMLAAAALFLCACATPPAPASSDGYSWVKDQAPAAPPAASPPSYVCVPLGGGISSCLPL